MKTKISKHLSSYIICGIVGLGTLCSFGTIEKNKTQENNGEAPLKIVNIVNFIRMLEPGEAAITEDVLYQTVVKQVDIMIKSKLGGTFLLQYDALLDPGYRELLKRLSKDSFEIGAPSPIVPNQILPSFS